LDKKLVLFSPGSAEACKRSVLLRISYYNYNRHVSQKLLYQIIIEIW